MEPSRTARIAVIGTGWWTTQHHLPTLTAHPDVGTIALCDRDPERLARASKAFPDCPTFPDVDQLLTHTDLDGAIVATSHASHFPVVRACLSAGLHVLVEKPMTLHAADAKALVGLARQHERQLLVGYPYLHLREIARVREVVAGGGIGDIELITAIYSSELRSVLTGDDRRFDPSVHGPGDVYSDPARSGGGHAHLQITHIAGLLFHVSSLRMEHVHALMHPRGAPIDWFDSITVRFDNGALGQHLRNRAPSGSGNTAPQTPATLRIPWHDPHQPQSLHGRNPSHRR